MRHDTTRDNITAQDDITQFERPAVTVDVLIFTIQDDELRVALIKRAITPYKGKWALPGGFVRSDETLDEAAQREVAEEAGVRDVFLEQLYTFGDLKRDPRLRVITVAYYALVPGEKTLAAATDAAEARWFEVNSVPSLAFDHDKILQLGIDRLRAKLDYSNIAYGLLPDQFRLSQLQRVYEIILGHPLDKRNFRKKILSLGLLEATGKMDARGAHRPAQLFRFKKRKVVFFS